MIEFRRPARLMDIPIPAERIQNLRIGLFVGTVIHGIGVILLDEPDIFDLIFFQQSNPIEIGDYFAG